jgi:plasmid replication initiation protein
MDDAGSLLGEKSLNLASNKNLAAKKMIRSVFRRRCKSLQAATLGADRWEADMRVEQAFRPATRADNRIGL